MTRLKSSIAQVIAVHVFCILTGANLPAGEPTTPDAKSITPAEAVYRSNVAMVDVLLRNTSDEDLIRLGTGYRSRENFPRAAAMHLIALRTKHDDPLTEYELACDFALWGQVKLGMRYIQAAANHGYWGYLVVRDDTDVNALKGEPTFGGALAKIKDAYAVQAPKNLPGMTLKEPSGAAPSAGWPVLIFLHGFGSNRHDFDDLAAYVATLGYIGITLDGTDVMGPSAYEWTRDSVNPTSDRIQDALKKLKTKIDPRRIYLQGFSQGAMHAAHVLADHPDLYAGAICNSPGALALVPTKLADPAHTGTIFVSVGDAEQAGIIRGANTIQKLWESAGRPVHMIQFHGGHQLPPDAESMLRTALEALSSGK